MFKRGLILSALFYFSFLLTGCGHLFYYPDRVLYSDLKKNNIAYEEVSFFSQDGTKIAGWYFRAQDKTLKQDPKNRWQALRPRKNRVLIHFHGNAQNVSTHFSQLYWTTQFGYDYFILDYRGYGASHGKPNHKGVQEDIVAAVDYIVNGGPTGVKPESVILYGQSVGGASLLGAYDNIKDTSKIQTVVVEGGFGSYQRIARRKMSSWWVSWPFQWLSYVLLSDKYAGEKNAEKITPVPLLVIHGKADNIVEPIEGQEIFAAAKEPKQLWLIDEANHLQTYYVQQGTYQEKLIHYLEGFESKTKTQPSEKK
jgi:fermentation-respiration switch protein FrsA (DUF1100 family)